MAKMIKNLSKNVVKADGRFHLREDLNFTDDGNRFRGFDYKGLPITTLRADGFVYCSIRVDYLDNQFVYQEWMDTEEYKLTDEFNGVEEIDLDKLIENCEKVLEKVNEMNEHCKSETLDTTAVVERLEQEKGMLTQLLDDAKTSVRWWELKQYEMHFVKDAFDGTVRELERVDKAINGLDTMDKKQVRQLIKRLERYGYVVFRENDYYEKTLREAM